MTKVITLTDDYFLAQGYHKKCYVHPENEHLCIKVPYTSVVHGDGRKEFKREVRFNEFMKKKTGWSKALPGYYGKMQTNLGEGIVYDLIRDYDGQISKSIYEYLQMENYLEDNFLEILNALKELKNAMFADAIITTNLFAHNVLYQRKDCSTINLVIIDDVGSKVLIPLEYYISSYARSTLRSKWKKFIINLKNCSNHPLLNKIIDEIS